MPPALNCGPSCPRSCDGAKGSSRPSGNLLSEGWAATPTSSQVRVSRDRAPSRPSAVCPGLWCRTTPGPWSSRRVCTSRRSTGPIRRWLRITVPACSPQGRAGRATRQLFHTAPCPDLGAVMGTSRAGFAPRPPQPLMMVWCWGIVHRPRFRLSL